LAKDEKNKKIKDKKGDSSLKADPQKTNQLDIKDLNQTIKAKDQKTAVLNQNDLKSEETVFLDQDEIHKEDTKLYSKETIEPQVPMDLTGEFMSESKSDLSISMEGITPDFASDDGYRTIDTLDQSKLLKNLFPEKSKEEQLKINRNFLSDLEPFRLEKLVEEIRAVPENLLTTFPSLDEQIVIPQSAITLIASRSSQNKSLMMLNMLINMAQIYPDKHFIFYTYEEPKREIEIKCINILGEQPFKDAGKAQTNLDQWKHELKHTEVKILLKKAEESGEFSGLKKFLEISPRIHIVDSCYTFLDLINSIQSFDLTFSMGAVFIDYFQKIRLEKERRALPTHSQLQSISAYLKYTISQLKSPLITAALYKNSVKNLPEYDQLSLDFMEDLGGIEQEASLIIGLQDYSKSKFIGSDTNDNFFSKLFSQSLINAEPMPDSFKTNPLYAIILAKILKNRSEVKSEVELILDKQLMKVRELTSKDIKLIRD